MSKEVAKVEKGGAVTVPDYGEHAGSGFEGTKGSDLSVPFLSILQSNSPQVENKDPEGAESGMLFNTVTRELIKGDEGIVFLPCHKEGPIWVEWVPRTKGGGFVGMHEPESDAVKGGTEIMHPETGKPTRKLRHGENELIETFYVYGLLLDKEGKEPTGFAVVSFTSTKIKPYRDWITAMYTLKGKPPIFANRALIKTAKQQNDAGTFYNFRIDPLGQTWAASLIDPNAEAVLLEEAISFRDMVMSGMARAAFETQEATVGDSGDAGDGGDGKAPF